MDSLVFSIVAKTPQQKSPQIIRGGLLTLIKLGSFTESGISFGALSQFGEGGGGNEDRPPVGKNARIRGYILCTSLGTDNTFIDAVITDFNNGRAIRVARCVAGQKVDFDFVAENNSIMTVTGDGATADGTAEWLAFIEELPN